MSVTFKSALLFTLAFSLIGAAVTGNAQATTPSSENDLQAAGGPNPGSATDAAAADPTPLPAAPVPQFGANATATDSWHGAVSIYGWFPGVHGTVGVLGHDAGFSSPFSDVFHALKGIIPIAVEADKGRLVIPIDYFWVKLANGTATPFTDITANYVNVHLTESILTPMIGYRLLDGEHLKIDALGGIRYWYVGQNLQLIGAQVPVPPFARSQTWVDGLGGARFIMPVGEKAAITVSGNAGAGGANLDYQVIGLFSYNFTPKLGMGLGWRYLDVDYRPGNQNQFVFDTIMSGALAGVYFNFGGKPPVPVAASCSASPTEVYPGDPVNATISTQNFNPKHTLTYNWSSTGAKVSGTGTTGNVDTTRPRAGQLHRHRQGHGRQREEEQRGFVQRRLHGQGAADLSAHRELLRQSELDCHQPERHGHHDCQQPGEPSADLQLDHDRRPVERQWHLGDVDGDQCRCGQHHHRHRHRHRRPQPEHQLHGQCHRPRSAEGDRGRGLGRVHLREEPQEAVARR